MNSPIGKPAFLAALGVLGIFLAWAFFHVPLVMRAWGPVAPATDPASLLALVAVAGLYLASHGLILAGLLLLLHRAAPALPAIRATLDLPPGPDRAAAHRALVAELAEAEAALPAATDDLEHNPAGAMLFILDHPRTQAAVVRTAVAVEFHRRATGALPPDLSSLVPSRLPAIPIDASTGAPLSYTPGDIGFILGYPDPADSSRPARPVRFPVP